MTETTTPTAERIRAFADAVRAELADLPVDELDDLVDGLIGDLTDQAQDNGGDIDLGDPAAYAQELRGAAGFPERELVATPRPPWPRRLAAAARDLLSRVRAHRTGAAVVDLLIALRPVWWVLRGVMASMVLLMLVGLGPLAPYGTGGLAPQVLSWILLLTLVLVSVQWGRGRWLPPAPLRRVTTVVSVIAVLAIPFAWGVLTGLAQARTAESVEQVLPGGLRLDGVQVDNLFVYDSEGALVDGAQIYTGRGTPLDLYGEQSPGLGSVRLIEGNGAEPAALESTPAGESR